MRPTLAAAVLVLFWPACGEAGQSKQPAGPDLPPEWGGLDVDSALVAAAFACEPDLTCGERDLAVVERRNSKGETYLLAVQGEPTFRRFNGREVRVLSPSEAERIASSGDRKFVLSFSLDWMDATSVQVMTRGRLLGKKAEASTASGSMGVGIACGNFKYHVQKTSGVWSCRESPPRTR